MPPRLTGEQQRRLVVLHNAGSHEQRTEERCLACMAREARKDYELLASAVDAIMNGEDRPWPTTN